MKVVAIVEGRIAANALHAVGDCDARKPAATIESIRADARHAVRNNYARKSGATIEGIIADARHAVWDCYARKSLATIECISADARHAVRNDNNRGTSFVLCQSYRLIGLLLLSPKITL